MTAFLDASLIVSHLIGDTDSESARALFAEDDLWLASDVTIADTVAVLESIDGTDRHLIATAIRSLLSNPNVECVDLPVLLRAIGIYEIDGVRFPAAHCVALAESTGVDRVASLDSTIDRAQTVDRIPSAAHASADASAN